MKAVHYIRSKQINWALNQGLILQGSEGERGEKAYTMTLEENLFEPLHPEVEKQFKERCGGELNSKESGYPCPMQAVHSSAALVVNVFQYWLKVKNFAPILEALGFPLIECNTCKFEEKFHVYKGTPPHLDVVFYCKDKVIAIESKFSKLYFSRSKKEEMQDGYAPFFGQL